VKVPDVKNPLPDGFLLSVVVPVYNEAETLGPLLERIRMNPVPCQVIVIDDGSTDGTGRVLEDLARRDKHLLVYSHLTNRGKGAALRTGFAAVSGQMVLIQDGDLEYDPADYRRLIGPILQDEADVVYGSRFLSGRMHRHGWFFCGNWLLTRISNLVNGLALTDMETCYKVFRRDVLETLAPRLREDRFGIEPEITARLARMESVRIREVPISYQGRSYAAGKKIRCRDGLRALWCIIRYGLFSA